MLDTMGMAAGELWQFLNKNGESSAAKIVKESELDTKSLQRAIGWLAKEDKLVITTKGRTELLALK
jgi:predicted transcriptional regulator